MSLEHLIPEALGGNLTSRLLCQGCNSRLGHQFEGQAKADPTVQLLTKNLTAEIPELAQRMQEGQRYMTVGPGPVSVGAVNRGRFRVHGAKLPDGSLVQETPVAQAAIRKMLMREGLNASEIDFALQRFDQAPDDTRLQLSPSVEVVKWSVKGLRPALDGPLLNDLVPIKSAYEFLALHVGDAICQETPPLAAIRKALGNGLPDTQDIVVERLHAPEAKAFHGIVFEGNTPHAKVQVRLFGKLAFRVHFKLLSIAGSRGMYTHDLSTKNEFAVQLPPNDA